MESTLKQRVQYSLRIMEGLVLHVFDRIRLVQNLLRAGTFFFQLPESSAAGNPVCPRSKQVRVAEPDEFSTENKKYVLQHIIGHRCAGQTHQISL